MAVAEVVTIKDPAQRKRAVKEQIASLGAEIVSGGEVVDNVSSLSYLRCSRRAWTEADRRVRSVDPSHHSTLLLRSSHRPQPQPRPETNPQPYERSSPRHRLPPRCLQGSHPWIPNPRAYRAGAVGEGQGRCSTTEGRRSWFGSSLRWLPQDVGEGDQGFVSLRFTFHSFDASTDPPPPLALPLYREVISRRSLAQVHV